MDHEQQRWLPAKFTGYSGIVECSNHRLAGAGRRDNQVPILMLDFALGSEDVEDFLLKGVGPQIKYDG
jgi:hypothetical protein